MDPMVIYDLICTHNHKFEAWFKDHSAFENQKKQGLIQCAVCGTSLIEKQPSGCHVPKSIPQKAKTNHKRKNVTASLKQKNQQIDPAIVLKTIHKHIKDNYKNVGNEFTEKAIKIHKGQAPQEAIYGTANLEQANQLNEEGVSYLPIPHLPESLEN